MISIMSSNALPQIPSFGQVSVPTGASSFSSLLDDDATPPASVQAGPFQVDANAPGKEELSAEQKDQRRLFTFTELGMFGRHHAQFTPAGKLDFDMGTQPESTSLVSIASLGTLTDVPLIEGNQARSIRDMSPSPCQLANEISTASDEPSLVPVQSVVQGPAENNTVLASADVGLAEDHLAANEVAVQEAMPPSVAAESFEVVPGEDALSPLEGGAPMPASSVDMKNPNPAPVNLAVLGSSDALVVSIRSPIEAGEGMVRLRQAIDSLAAEFGMDVAELRINGSPLNQISPSAKGGSNGGRAG
jgi:hypothetical protein